MKLQGMHHITMIIGDAQRNVGFTDEGDGEYRLQGDERHVHWGYFRQPHGILFEIATTSPGFAVDENLAHLGEQLRLPRQHEHLRPQLERHLTPIINPRVAAPQEA